MQAEFFWTGRWTLSRVLFFINRYFSLGVLANTVVAATSVVQAIIVLRICYVYSKNLIARTFVVGTFVACVTSTCAILGVLWHDLEAVPTNLPGLKITTCTAPPSKAVWKLFVPNIVLHTVLYLATTIPALKMRRLGRKSMLMDRLVMDGGIFYFVVFVAAMFSALGALSGTLLVTIPAIYSNILLGLSSVAVSRLMLSIRCLAASLSLQPNWLLNNTELSRVNWKHGPHDGELIVEVEAFERFEMDDMDSPTDKGAQTSFIHVSRVGVPNHPVYPGTRDYKSPPRVKRKKPALAGI
ncbi:hypothetical protein GSI_05879 [Ganoderma sinense ZZ0214-1]|uniref:Uncharacterized protein n=1 Tax=Ganoderma sinense ZZ0214-1 TaxID=1077348 RepID=A0A2G8SBR1_9APHY|nr:hypothetical protein GSI_05879 [Ganoderma sinense ZZ0214-1]